MLEKQDQLSKCLSWETEKIQIRENKGHNKGKSKTQWNKEWKDNWEALQNESWVCIDW